MFTSITKPHVLVFSETWLSDNVPNDSLEIPGYQCPLRQDRPANKRGGGVCVYARQDVLCKRLEDVTDCPAWIESISILLPNHKLVLLSLYVPPNLTSAQLSAVNDWIASQADSALSHVEDSKIIILGDLNQLPTTDIEQTLGSEASR